MLDLRFARAVPRSATVVALAVVRKAAPDDPAPDDPAADTEAGDLDVLGTPPAGVDAGELAAFLREVEHKGKAGSVQTWVPVEWNNVKCDEIVRICKVPRVPPPGHSIGLKAARHLGEPRSLWRLTP